MTKDIGIVFLPNQQCRNFALHISNIASEVLPNYKKLPAIPHITAIHIANQNEENEARLKDVFRAFADSHSAACIELPIKGVKATGGSPEEGYKWLDLQFETLSKLANLRQAVVGIFCPFHNGTLTRIYDEKLNDVQQEEVRICGVTFKKYTPHITAWYIDLPNEPKTTKLEVIANSLQTPNYLECSVKSIALVELGRNGNAVSIIEQYPLCIAGNLNHEEL
jgi:2'-5' RNA ligase